MAITNSSNNKYNIYYSKCQITEGNTIPSITLPRLFGQFRDIYNLCVDLWKTGDYTNCKILNKFEVDLSNVISRDLEYRKYLIDEIINMAIFKFFEDKEGCDEVTHLTRKDDKLILQFRLNRIQLSQNGFIGIQAPIMGKEYELPLSCSDPIPEEFIKNALGNLVSLIIHEKDGYYEIRVVCNNHI